MKQALTLAREISDVMRLFDEKSKRIRRLVFFSEKDMYFQYFEGLINYILENSNLEICYLTSDPNDRVFSRQDGRIHPFYVKHSLSITMSKLDSELVIMTMPDLDNFFVKRSPSVGKYLYKFHAIVSTHQQYRPKAFDNFDTIFCVGQHHVDEIRKTEELDGLPAKHLVESGYHLLEKIYQEHRQYLARPAEKPANKTVLVAPTWGPTSLLEAHFDEIVVAFRDTPYTVQIRPHPQSVLTKPELLGTIRKSIKDIPNIGLESDLPKPATIHEADVLVTDRSGIAFEYAFGTERPVLFIDTPLKRSNPDGDRLELEPMENKLRDEIGVRLPLTQMSRMPELCSDFGKYSDRYRKQIVDCRERSIFNWLESSRIEGEYVLSMLKSPHS